MIGAGAFVRFGGALADVYEGFLPARVIGGRERYELDETETMLVGMQGGDAIRIGDPVSVTVEQGRGPARAHRPRAGRSGARADGRQEQEEEAARRRPRGDVATNRRARHKFKVLESFECGIVLQGSEVKSLRDGKASLNEAYAVVEEGEVWLRGAPYPAVPARQHPEPRPRPHRASC